MKPTPKPKNLSPGTPKTFTPKQAKEAIDAAFLVVRRLSNLNTETQNLFERAHDAAVTGERHNRRHAWAPGGRWRSSVETSARYFVVRWFSEPAEVSNAREAAALRTDCLCASALRLAIEASRKGSARVFDTEDAAKLSRVLDDIDYADHLSDKE